MLNEKGFTLIELIVSMVLVGILAAIAGMGLVKITEGYVFAKQNAETFQKAQIAMARIVKELGAAEKASAAATAITTADADSVAYTRRQSSGSTTFIPNTITISNGLVQLSGTTVGILTNDVITASSGFAYYDGTGATTSVPANIRRIVITLTVNGANSTPISFNNTVFIQESY